MAQFGVPGNKLTGTGYMPVSSKALDSNIISINKPSDLFQATGWDTLGRSAVGALILARLLRKKAQLNSLAELIKINS